MCEFVGAIIGDGNLWTDNSRYRVELTGDPKLDRSYFEHLSKLAVGLFDKEPYDLKVRQKGLRFRLQSKVAFEQITGLGIIAGNGKARNVTIPKVITARGWNYVKWTLRGIFDTDGTLFLSKKTYGTAIYPTLEIRTYSKELGKQIDYLLKERGFRSRLRGDDRLGFHIGLYGFEMLQKWSHEIGFSNPRHINKYLSSRDKLAETFLPQ
jgi:LAGLIDADG-like domain